MVAKNWKCVVTLSALALLLKSSFSRVRTLRFRAFSALVALFAVLALPAASQAVTWDGGGGDLKWNTATNWDGDVVPTIADAVIIGTGVIVTLDAPGGVAKTVDIQGTANVVTSGGVQSLTIAGPGTSLKKGFNSSGGIDLGSAANPVNFVLTDSQTWTNPAGSNSDVIVPAGNNITLGTTTDTETLTFTGATNNNTWNIASVISDGSGTLAVAVQGGNTQPGLVLSGANTYSGLTTISANNTTQGFTADISNASALGSVTSGTVVNSGAGLRLSGGITTLAEPLTLNGVGTTTTAGPGALRNTSGTNTYAGVVTLGTEARINSDGGTLILSAANSITATNQNLLLGGASNGTVSGTITTGTGTLTKDGAGTWTLGGANTYTGDTTVSLGSLILDTAGVLLFDIDGDGTVPSTYTQIFGAAGGTESLSVLGDFNFDLAGADVTSGNMWQIVDTDLTVTYGPLFDVVGFTADGGGILHSLVNGSAVYTFSESSGILSLAIIPEPSAFLLAVLGLSGIGCVGRRRRQQRS